MSCYGSCSTVGLGPGGMVATTDVDQSGPGRSGWPALRAQRFRKAALPCLDEIYTFARILLPSQQQAEDAVLDCYSRAQHQFTGHGGHAVKPWLFKILRTACHAELARLGRPSTSTSVLGFGTEAEESIRPDARPILGCEPPRQRDNRLIRQGVEALPLLLREVIALRECNGLSYRDIAEVTGAPVETVISRLAQARSMLLATSTTADTPRGVRPLVVNSDRATAGAALPPAVLRPRTRRAGFNQVTPI